MNIPQPNFYDPENAARLCQASADAYSSPQPSPRSGEGARRQSAGEVVSAATDVRVLLIDEGPDLIIAFRGTTDLCNWLTDLDCAFVPASFGQVHAGFTAALNSVYVEIAETIFDAHYAGKRIWLTGHSLGGALAMMCARQLIKPLAGCYTFGQPRVGDARYCESYDALLKDRTHRVVHEADIIARVPWLLGAYRHAGHEIFYPSPKITNDRFAMTNSQSQSLRIPQWQVDPSFWTKLPGDTLALANGFLHGKLSLLDDHHISTYLALFPGRADLPVGLSPDAQQPRKFSGEDRVPTTAHA